MYLSDHPVTESNTTHHYTTKRNPRLNVPLYFIFFFFLQDADICIIINYVRLRFVGGGFLLEMGCKQGKGRKC